MGDRILAPGRRAQQALEQKARLRASCDSCQDHKIKCSQHKPKCRRCSQNKLECIYSPFRRMGRPRRYANSSDPGTTDSAKTPTRLTPGVAGTPNLGTVYSGAEAEVIGDLDPAMFIDDQTDGLARFCNDVPTAEGHHTAIDTLASNAALSVSTRLSSNSQPALDEVSIDHRAEGLFTHPSASLATNDLHHAVPCATNGNDCNESSGADGVLGATQPGRHEGEGKDKSCYVAVLNRLGQLEQSLQTSVQPRLDLILSAEEDIRLLKERLFSCQGHADTQSEKCLRVHDSSLLVLGLLLGRVIGLLEDMFERAAMSDYSIDRVMRQSTWFMSASPTTPFNQASDRHLERSLRGSFTRSISCPVPEANCDLTIGNYEVNNEVTGRIIKQILARRVRALEKTLEDMRAHVASQHDQIQASAAEWSKVLQGGSGGRGSTTVAATIGMVNELRHRAELLNGRMELIA